MKIWKSIVCLFLLLTVLFTVGCADGNVVYEDSLPGERGALDTLSLPEEMPADFSLLLVWHVAAQWNGIDTYRGVIYKETEKRPARFDYEIPQEDLEEIYRELKNGLSWIPGTGEPVNWKQFDFMPTWIIAISFDGKVYPLTDTGNGENGYFEYGELLSYVVSYIKETDEWKSIPDRNRPLS